MPSRAAPWYADVEPDIDSLVQRLFDQDNESLLTLLKRTAPKREYDPYLDESYLPPDYVAAAFAVAQCASRKVALTWVEPLVSERLPNGCVWPVTLSDEVSVIRLDEFDRFAVVASPAHNDVFHVPFNKVTAIRVVGHE